MTAGERIQYYRKKNGLTQKELAEKLDLAEITIRQYESNKRQPKIQTLRKIACILGVSVEAFLTEAELSLFESMANLYLESDTDIKEVDSLDEHTPQEKHLMIKFRELNEKGRNKVIDYADDLSKTRDYTKAGGK